MKIALRVCAVFALLAASACENILLPDNRKDPGTVVVHVRDTAGAPIQGVWVYIELPNSVGSTFWEGTPTRADGTVTHHVIPAGRRTLEVKPPAGYTVVGEAKQAVDVEKDRTVTTSFTLQKS